MRFFIFGFLFFLVYAAIARWHFVCEIRNHCGNQEIPRLRTLSHEQSNPIILDGFGQLIFSQAAIRRILTDDHRAF